MDEGREGGSRRRLLLVDNYDSYTFNLYQYLAVICGEPPTVIKNCDARGTNAEFLSEFAGVVLSPGPGRPQVPSDIGITQTLIQQYEGPILGVCLGFQVMAFLNGAAVVRAPRAIHGEIAEVHHDGRDPLFHNIPSPFKAVRYHSLIVDPSTLASPLHLTAVTYEEGDGYSLPSRPPWVEQGHRVIPMGLRVEGRAQYAIQYHPESICTQYGHQLIANFAKLCGVEENWIALPSGPAPSWGLPDTPRWDLHVRKLPGWAGEEEMSDVALRAFTAIFATSPSAVWLDSSRDKRGRFSYCGDASGPESFVVQFDCDEGLASGGENLPGEGGVLERIQRFLHERAGYRVVSRGPLPFPFHGGFMGYIGYELRKECVLHAHGVEAAREVDLGPRESALDLPDLHMVFVDRFLAFDHHERTAYACSLVQSGSSEEWLATLPDTLPHTPDKETQPAVEEKLTFTPSLRKDGYLQAIRRSQELISEGETYEVCLTNQFEATLPALPDPLAFYTELREINAAPYSAFISIPGKGAVCSTSPERFLSVSPSGECETKPIKGTIRRDLNDPVEDARLAEELRTSKKDCCENLMIVDLLRNDLGMVSLPGSVRVPKLMDIESYKTVHQMVTTIHSTLPRGKGAIDVVNVAFPGGSIVGAPKVRTMKIIQQLEGRRRGVYTGSIGFLSLNGAADLSIVIRTAFLGRTRTRTPALHIGAGGAITALSDPEGEWDEIMIKAAPLLRAASRILTGSQQAYSVAF